MTNPTPTPVEPSPAAQKAGVFISKGALAVGFIAVGAAIATSYKLGGGNLDMASAQGSAIMGMAAGALDSASRSVIHGIDAAAGEVAHFASVKGAVIGNFISAKAPVVLEKALTASVEGIKEGAKYLGGLYAGTTGLKSFKHITAVATGKKTAENGAKAIVDEHAKALKKTTTAMKRCLTLLKEIAGEVQRRHGLEEPQPQRRVPTRIRPA